MKTKSHLFSWIKSILLGSASLFFLVMGIEILLSSYSLKHPTEFLLSFFASNLIILISAVGCIAAFLMIRKQMHPKNDQCL